MDSQKLALVCAHSGGYHAANSKGDPGMARARNLYLMVAGPEGKYHALMHYPFGHRVSTRCRIALCESLKSGSQFARVVKGVDLRSTAGNCAWARTPQLATHQRKLPRDH